MVVAAAAREDESTGLNGVLNKQSVASQIIVPSSELKELPLIPPRNDRIGVVDRKPEGIGIREDKVPDDEAARIFIRPARDHIVRGLTQIGRNIES